MDKEVFIGILERQKKDYKFNTTISGGEMREYKFRYLITGSNKLPIMKEFTLVDLVMGATADHIKCERDIKFCGEFTGLQDNNGKDAYPGDITDRGVIIFSEDYYGYFIKDEEGNQLPLYDLTFEIIGNIHENGELLK